MEAIKKIIRKADIALVITIICIAAATQWYFWQKSNEEAISIYLDNQIFLTTPLTGHKIIPVLPTLIVEVDKARYRVKSSDCQGQHCVHQGWQNHLPIVCLPNKLLIKPATEQKIIITH